MSVPYRTVPYGLGTLSYGVIRDGIIPDSKVEYRIGIVPYRTVRYRALVHVRNDFSTLLYYESKVWQSLVGVGICEKDSFVGNL